MFGRYFMVIIVDYTLLRVSNVNYIVIIIWVQRRAFLSKKLLLISYSSSLFVFYSPVGFPFYKYIQINFSILLIVSCLSPTAI